MAKQSKSRATPSLFDSQDAMATEPHQAAPPPENPLPAELDESWLAALTQETHQPYWNRLQQFVAEERAKYTVYPPAEDVYNAFRYTPLNEVKVFLLGQDPYPGPGQAHGLCFSVRPGVPLPGSLRNIFKELHDDLGIPPAKHGYLASWARQGILMLNACLTVRANSPNSHAGKGWERFTDAAILAVNELPRPVIFLLWGGYAQKKLKLIDESRHVIIKSAHPSPLSAANGFFGSKPFSKVNASLKKLGGKAIDWQLPEAPREER